MSIKYLGIDYGTKKVGFAQSDDEGRFAFPLMISDNNDFLLKDTLELIKEMKIGTVVVGESVNAQGKLNEVAKEARKFAMMLEAKMPITVVFEKEWYSTQEARTQPGKEGDHNVDDQAATIILQRYLDKLNGPGEYEEERGDVDDDGDVEGADSW